jgi:hypothetical protein
VPKSETIVIDVIPFLEKLFPPDPERIFDEARRLADDESLQEIARADYGQQADEMFVLLRSIRDTGELPSEFPFQLGEVLSLSRFHDPESPGNPAFHPARGGLAGHKTRLFAVAVLLKLGDELGFDSNLARCLHSAGAIGHDITVATGSFLTWWQKDSPRNEEAFFEPALRGLGLLICANQCADVSDESLGQIADWVLAVDAQGRAFQIPGPGSNCPAPFSVTQGFWEPLAAELRSRADRIPAGAAKTSLECCALLLDPGW